jgi:hypothetical protein
VGESLDNLGRLFIFISVKSVMLKAAITMIQTKEQSTAQADKDESY